MPYNKATIHFLLGLDLVLVWTCVLYIQGQYVSVNMSEKDNTESQGCCRKNLQALAAGFVLFLSLIVIGLLTLLSWVYVNKVPDSPYSREQPKHHLFSYNHRYIRPRPNLNVRKSYQRSSIAGNNEMKLYIVQAGLLTGAVCLDGSPPAYYLRKGKDVGSNRWIIHFNGGAWCFDESACLERSRSSLGSSKNLPSSPPVIQGINSPDPQVNPDFFDWNLVWVVYCDGASFTGNRDSPVNVDGDFIYFRGKRIIDAVFEDLLLRGFDNAERLILTGSSAGSMTALFASDHIARKFAPTIPVRVLSDAGFFVETSPMGGKNVGAMFKQIYDMQNSSAGLNEGCIRTYGEGHGWRCFLPETTFKFIRTPSFILNAAYDVWALIYFMGINCKFPSNSYSREKRGIDLILPYLHSNKKRSATKRKRDMSKTHGYSRRFRDISGFEILPFFRPQLSDRESLPIYQPFDQDNYFEPDRNQGPDRPNDNSITGGQNNYNKSPYSQSSIDNRVPVDRSSPVGVNSFENNPQQSNEFVDEQAAEGQPLDEGPIDSPYTQQATPTVGPFIGQRPTSSAVPDQGNFINNINQLNEWPDKSPLQDSQVSENPLYPNTLTVEDLTTDIASQSAGLNSESRAPAPIQDIPGTAGKPVHPFDSLVNSLKNVTRKKAEDKKVHPGDGQVMIGEKVQSPQNNHNVFNKNLPFAQEMIPNPPSNPGITNKQSAGITQGKPTEALGMLKQQHDVLRNGSAQIYPNLKVQSLKFTNISLDHLNFQNKQIHYNKRFNATIGNRTNNKNQNKRSTNIAKEYISILRSDPPECTDTDMVDVMKYRETMLRATEVIRSSPRSGVFLVSCIDHSLSLFDETWSTIIVNGKSIAQAFGDWYLNRPTNHHDIDCPYPCNPSCP